MMSSDDEDIMGDIQALEDLYQKMMAKRMLATARKEQNVPLSAEVKPSVDAILLIIRTLRFLRGG